MEALVTEFWWVLIIAVLWTLPWKMVALWKVARRGERGWFVALFFINMLAILEIFYIFVVTKRKDSSDTNV